MYGNYEFSYLRKGNGNEFFHGAILFVIIDTLAVHCSELTETLFEVIVTLFRYLVPS